MKKTLTILLAVAVLGLFISQTVLAQPGPGRGDGRGWGRGPRDGQGRGFRQGGGQFGRVNPVELMQFLEHHEPRLAETLKALQENDLEEYRRKMFAVMKVYGPAMRQMERNPEMGQLTLEKVRLCFEIEQKVKKYNGTQDEFERKQIKTKLKQILSSLFDNRISQEEKRLDQWQQRMQNWADQDFDPDGRGRGRGGMGRGQGGMGRGQGGMGRGQGGMPGMGRGQGMGRGPGMGRGQGGPGRGQGRRGGGFQDSMEERKKLISIWHDQKKAIVNARATELLQITKPFPWN